MPNHGINLYLPCTGLTIISESHFAINESIIKFHEFNKNKFQLRHKSVKESFVIYILINNKNILHDFMLWNLQNDLEYNKKNITINISSRTIKERQKNIINIIVIKIYLSLTKKMIYILCERIIHNLHHFNSCVSLTIFSLILISSKFFWLLILTYVIS